MNIQIVLTDYILKFMYGDQTFQDQRLLSLEVMKKACECVNDLFNKIYDDYKIYCSRMNINPVSKIAKKIDGGKNCLKYSDFI